VAVLQEAVKRGANLVLTAEPTFYSRADARTPRAGRGGRGAAAGAPPATPAPAHDPVFAGKNDFITKSGLVIFRLSDHWKLRRPDPLAAGLGETLGWAKYQVAGDPRRYDLPAPVALDALVSAVAKGLGSRGGVRVIGDAKTQVRRVGLLPGSTPIEAALALLPQVDVVIGGEVREWESAEYARDTVFAGAKKGLVLVGRIVSEEPGMRHCANWLKGLLPEVPRVGHVPAGDPYWRPA
jgi:hypothetical protein